MEVFSEKKQTAINEYSQPESLKQESKASNSIQLQKMNLINASVSITQPVVNDNNSAMNLTSAVKTRSELQQKLRKLLHENNVVFSQYGPTNENAHLVLSDKKELWERSVKNIIIPNNNKILELLETNSALLTVMEQKGIITFKLHKEFFEFNHTNKKRNVDTPMFPSEYFDNLIMEDKNA